ncbi:hypothetical protein SK128_004251 [Halocaridina rubra]|uniref:Uncharacterized protein n=1 Tax=Halocaridina rubra TaxID=373956 RepID=A0AAN8XL38_HALRR
MQVAVLLFILALSLKVDVVRGSPIPNPDEEGTAIEEPQDLPHLIIEPEPNNQVQPIEPIKADLQPVELIKVALQPVEPIKDDLQPVEPIKDDLQPVEAIKDDLQPVEPIKDDLQPVEPIKDDLQPVDPIKDDLQPVEPIKDDLQPVEPIKDDLQPVDPIKDDLQPVEPIKDDLQPVEPIKDDLQPVEPIKDDLQPVEPIKDDLQPVEPIKEDLQPVEPIKEDLQPVEPIKDNLQPVEPIKEDLQPVEPIIAGLEHTTPIKTEFQPVEPINADLQPKETTITFPSVMKSGDNDSQTANESPQETVDAQSKETSDTAADPTNNAQVGLTDHSQAPPVAVLETGESDINAVADSDSDVSSKSSESAGDTADIPLIPVVADIEDNENAGSEDTSEVQDNTIDEDVNIIQELPPKGDHMSRVMKAQLQAGSETETNTEMKIPKMPKAEDAAKANNVVPVVISAEFPVPTANPLVPSEDILPTPSSPKPQETENTKYTINLDKSCTQPPLTGTCRGAFPMFYFDPNSRTCKQFVYGGCRGNANVHKTVAACYTKCYPEGLQTAVVASGRSSLNDYLTVRDGTGASILTFTGPDAAARIDPVVLGDFTITDVYAFDFHFRTDAPHGLIAFLRQIIVPENLEGARIQLYIHLTKGHLAVTHVLGHSTETFIMRKGGLQAGSWHSAYVHIDATSGELYMDVDHTKEYFTIKSLIQNPHYAGERTTEEFTSLLWIGGVFEEELDKEAMVYGFVPFHGCIQQMSVSSGKSPEDMKKVQPFVATEHNGVKEHCSDNCHSRFTNLCSPKSHCVEHFDHSSCNCFNSGQDGPLCNDPAVPVLTLSGDGYLVHRLYEWMDRVHSYTNLISIGFKTRFADSILFYASAEHPERQYIAASITEHGQIYVEVNLGGGVANATFGKNINSEVWRRLIIVHQHEKILLYLDNTLYVTLIVPGNIHYFHLDPEIYIGNAPRLARECGLALDTGSDSPSGVVPTTEGGQRYYYDTHSGNCHAFNYSGFAGNANRFLDEESCKDTCHTPGLHSMNTFLGCLKSVFFNDVSILQSLKENKKSTKYYGSSKEVPLGETCQDTKFLPVTFSTERAAMKLFNPQPNNFQLILSFKPTQPKGVLASGMVNLTNYESVSEWELRHDNEHVYFYLHDNLMAMKSDGKIKIGHWQYVELRYSAGRINMMVNSKKQGKQTPGKLLFSHDLIIGRNILEDYPGFIGCLRELHVGDTKLDLRTVVGTPMVNSDVTYDNCKVIGPCEGPRACEHGGLCSIDQDGEVQCDCTGTGYSGKMCHFSLYKRSCEQYRQAGYNSSGIYLIDVDGNGPLPPSYVKCEFNPLLEETYTIIEHNVEKAYEVRKTGMKDFRMDIQYRDFTPEMLQYLQSQSDYCYQDVTYECRRSPLKLSTRTWFSSPSQSFISNFGTKAPGVCRCSELRSCDNPKYPCNCDINDGVLRRDIAHITHPDHLPITSMVLLQGEDRREDSEAYVTLEPFKCVTRAVKGHTVSFTDSDSYLEVPAWREGSFLLTFKTTSKQAVIVYQPAHHPNHATFIISLVGDNELEFQYHYKEVLHHKVISTSYPLNDGQWQQILVDVYNQQLRFVINDDERLIEVDPNVYLGVLDGSMYLGGIPEEFRELEDDDLQTGLVGCIKGLTVNDEVINMQKLLRATARGVALGCNPSCDPDPCKNGATCIEKWGSYECKCTNPFAHSGQNCEINLNDDAITLTTQAAKYKHFSNATDRYAESILSENFMLNFRTHSSSGTILFAYNHLHNFIQLHLASENQVDFLFNYGNEIKKIEVTAVDGVVFNQGQPVQVLVERTAFLTALTVYTEGQTFSTTLDVGLLQLQEDQYQQFPFEESDVFPELVYYPHSMTKPTHFFLLYLGSANDKNHDIRSELPGIAGCIRGLQIGQQIVSLPNLLEQSPYRHAGVIPNCRMVCDRKPCQNGGKCTENYRRSTNFNCDCSETSYYGSTCKSELAYHFHGNEWISEDSSTSPLHSDFRFEVAFSAYYQNSQSQAIAFLRSTDPSRQHDYLLIWCGKDGSLTVEAQFEDYDPEMVHGVTLSPKKNNFNAFDNFRHFVVVEKKGEVWTIKIDGKEHKTEELKYVYIPETQVKNSATALFLGGIEKELDDRMLHYDNFHGCISNVRIITPEGEARPFKQYSDADPHMRNWGLPGQGNCKPFAGAFARSLKLLLPDREKNKSSVIGNEWAYSRPLKMPYQAPEPNSGEYVRETAFDNVVPIVSGIIIAIALLIAMFLLLRTRNKKMLEKKRREMEEDKPIFNGKNMSSYNDERTKTLYIESTDETVPLKSAPDGIEMSEKPEVNGKKHEEIPLAEKSTDDKEPGADKEDTVDVPQDEQSDDKDVSGEVEVHKDAPENNEEVQA